VRRSSSGDDHNQDDHNQDHQNQSVFDWLEREQQEQAQDEQRSGLDRRSGVARRGSVQNRREERRSIPFSVAPRGEVRAEDGRHWHCTLWDVSQRGLCVVANGCFELPLGSELSISLFEVVGLGSAAFKANLRWFASDEFQTYLGLQFSEPSTLPPDTFLERYLQTDFNV
jgi:c-di-GMP-binding flagellar brake protein YcgR